LAAAAEGSQIPAAASTVLACVTAAEPASRRIAAFLGESLPPEDTACATPEGDDGRWRVAAREGLLMAEAV
jgi:hypothetical protein